MAPELQQAAAPLLADAKMTPEKLAETKLELQAQRSEAERVAEETFEERMEEAAHKGIEAVRLRFQEVTQRTGLHGNAELSEEVAEMITRPGGVTAQFVAPCTASMRRTRKRSWNGRRWRCECVWNLHPREGRVCLHDELGRVGPAVVRQIDVLCV